MKTFTAIKCILLGTLLIAAGCGLRAFERATAPEALRTRVLAECADLLDAQVALKSIALDGLTTIRAQQLGIAPLDGSADVFAAAGIVVELDEPRLIKGLEIVPRRITVLSPTIELTWLPEEQSWNFQAIKLKVPAEPGPPTPGLLRDGVHLRDVTLRLSTHDLFDDAEPRVYTNLDLTLTPLPGAPDRWTLAGRFTRGLLQGIRITGDLDTSDDFSANIRFAANDFPVGETLWRTLPFCQVVWDDVKVTGRASFVTTLAIGPDGVRHHTLAHATDATADLSFYPLPLQDVAATVEVTDDTLYIRNARALATPKAFGLTDARPATRLLVDCLVPFDGRPSHISVRADQLPLCKQSILSIPGVGNRIWEELKPDGTASLDLNLTIPPDGDVHAAATCRMQAMSIQPRGFKLKDLAGTLHYDTRTGLHTEGLAGVLPTDQDTPARVNVQVKVSPDGTSTAVTARIENLPLTHPPVAARIQEQLGDLKAIAPSGLVDADVRVLLRDSEPEPQISARCSLRDVALHAAGPLPLDIERISGTLAYDGDAVRLENVTGIVRQKDAAPARLSAAGIYDTRGIDTALQVKVNGLRTTEALCKSIPDLEELWTELQPLLTLDADVAVSSPAKPDGKLLVQATAQIRGGTAHVTALQMPMAAVTGRILLDTQGRIIVENLRAQLPGIGIKTGVGDAKPTPAFLEISGSSHIAKQKHDYKLAATGLFIGKPMLDRIPEIGRQIWTSARPQGLVDATGIISADAGRARPLQYRFDVDMKDLSALIRNAPLPITGLTGHVLISDRQAICSDLTGIIGSGRATGSVVVYYGPERAKPSYGASLNFRQVQLGALVQAFSDPEAKPKDEDKAEISGRLAGTVDVGGIINSKVGSIVRSHITLTEARLWKTPLLAGLIPLLHLNPPKSDGSGEATFSVIAGDTKVHLFSLTNEGVTITGAGDISRKGVLDLDLVAVGARDDDAGIPIISPLFGWLWRGVESQLFRVNIHGTVDKPEYQMQMLNILTAPITGIGNILATPFRKSP